MATGTMNLTLSCGGITVQGSAVRTAEGQISQDVVLPAADDGELTTRTSDTAGTLTMESGHGISTGDEIDIFWTASGVAKCARGATVGTVAGLSVPFTGASGDALPTLNSDVTADERVEVNTDFDGDDVLMVAMKSTRKGHFDFQDSGSATLHQAKFIADEPWFWVSDTGASNPLTGNPVDKLFLSNGDSANAATVKLGILYDSV